MNAPLAQPLAPPADIAAEPVDRGVLRFITAGSVDDGKSTLIGRLLYDTRSVLADQLQALARAGERRAATRVITPAADAAVDLSLLTDGLEAEREQGITIDVAYRYFATARRKFIIADTPGHEQYTRNMVTGASTADAAVILIDATRVQLDELGHAMLLPQTRRHAALIRLLGLRHVAVAVNKMDAFDFDPARFEAIVDAFGLLARRLQLTTFTAIPLSALQGDNVVRRSGRTPWYAGPVLLDWLETIDNHDTDTEAAPFRFAVQGVVKAAATDPAQGARLYTGRIGAGRVAVGDRLRVLPAQVDARVASIETYDGPLAAAATGRSVALRLDREVDASRGDWLVAADDAQPEITRRLTVDLAWLDHEPLAPQRRLWLRHGTRFTLARVRSVVQVFDLAQSDWRAPAADAVLAANDIARVQIETQQPLPLEPYEAQRATGALVLIDAATHRTVAAGIVRAAGEAS